MGRGQRTEVRRQRSEVRRQRAEGGCRHDGVSAREPWVTACVGGCRPEGAKHMAYGGPPWHGEAHGELGYAPSGLKRWIKMGPICPSQGFALGSHPVPLRGVGASRPRASPWAGILCPFGAWGCPHPKASPWAHILCPFGAWGAHIPRLRPGLASCAPSGRGGVPSQGFALGGHPVAKGYKMRCRTGSEGS